MITQEEISVQISMLQSGPLTGFKLVNRIIITKHYKIFAFQKEINEVQDERELNTKIVNYLKKVIDTNAVV